MRTLVYTALAAGLCLAGCGEKQPPQDSANIPKPDLPAIPTKHDQAKPGVAPPPPPGAPVPPAAQAPPKTSTHVEVPGATDENGVDVGLNKLNEALRRFVNDTERLPTGLEELVKSGVIQRIPTPPPGKRYAIDSKSKTALIVNK